MFRILHKLHNHKTPFTCDIFELTELEQTVQIHLAAHISQAQASILKTLVKKLLVEGTAG